MRRIKDKVAPVFNTALHHEGIWGNGAIAPRILNPDNRWTWVVRFSPWCFTTQNTAPETRSMGSLVDPEESHAPVGNQTKIFRSSRP